MATPEKLNLWDRIFNRKRREIINRGQETWVETYNGQRLANSEFVRRWVEYKVIDRLTGSEKIERHYLN